MENIAVRQEKGSKIIIVIIIITDVIGTLGSGARHTKSRIKE